MEKDVVEKSAGTISAVMYVSILLSVFLLIIVVLFTAFLAIDVDLSGSVTANNTTNGELHIMNGTIGFFTLDNSIVDGYTTVCSGVTVQNGTGGIVITTGNYTASSACIISNLTDEYDLSNWSVNYTATWDITNTTTFQSSIGSIQDDVVGLVTNFFALMPTVGTILAVIILIAAIVVLVVYVGRMKNSGTSEKQYTG